MIHKIKNILLAVLCVAAIGAACGVSAQNGGNRQPVKQTEINQLIEFYEWAFETQFTNNERELYQSYVLEGFRQNAAEARKGVDILIKFLAKVRASDETKQAEMRRMFNEGFVADLRAANDEESKLMLAIYERGQSGANDFEKNEEDFSGAPKSTTNGGANFSKLVGAWFRSDGTGGATDGTGKTRYNSGTDMTFEFFADGKMRVTIKKETLSITQCKITETTDLPGTYSIGGNKLMMNLGMGTSIGTNSCDRAGNFKKSLSPSTITQTFVVKNLESVFRPDAPLILCLDGAADDKCLERLPNR